MGALLMKKKKQTKKIERKDRKEVILSPQDLQAINQNVLTMYEERLKR